MEWKVQNRNIIYRRVATFDVLNHISAFCSTELWKLLLLGNDFIKATKIAVIPQKSNYKIAYFVNEHIFKEIKVCEMRIQSADEVLLINRRNCEDISIDIKEIRGSNLLVNFKKPLMDILENNINIKQKLSKKVS